MADSQPQNNLCRNVSICAIHLQFDIFPEIMALYGCFFISSLLSGYANQYWHMTSTVRVLLHSKLPLWWRNTSLIVVSGFRWDYCLNAGFMECHKAPKSIILCFLMCLWPPIHKHHNIGGNSHQVSNFVCIKNIYISELNISAQQTIFYSTNGPILLLNMIKYCLLRLQ